MHQPLPDLVPGDCLIYRTGLWKRLKHIEVYDGSDRSLASRLKVDRYDTAYIGLCAILRPLGMTRARMEGARHWFEVAARHRLRVLKPGYFASCFYREAGIVLFHNDLSPYAMTVELFMASPLFDHRWKAL
jgi:hypothetical protein